MYEEALPTTNWKKAYLVAWLTKRNIRFPVNAFRPEHLQLAQVHKEAYRSYRVDKFVAEAEGGHEVVQLPPFHCHFNPIEMVEGIAKRAYRKINGKGGHFGVANTKKSWEHALNRVTPDVWANGVR